MAIVGDAELLVNLKLAPGAAAKLQKDVDAALKGTKASIGVGGAGKATGAGSSPVTIRPDVDTSLAQKKLDAFRMATERSFAKQSKALNLRPQIDTKAIRGAEKDIAGLGDNIARFGKQAGASIQQFTGLSLKSVAVLAGLGLAADPIVLVFRAIVTAVSAAIRASRDLNEALTATRIVFGKSASEITAFAEGAATIGLSETAALNATRAFGSLFKGVGANEEQAALLSERFTRLAADVASFQNIAGGTTEVAERFRSALVGNFEAVEKLNFNLRASDVTNELFRRGLVNTRSEITSEVQTLGTAIVLRGKLKDAAGDYARTADELANSQRTANAELENFTAAAGEALVPIAQLAVALGTGLIRQLGNFGKGLKFIVGIPEDIRKAISAIAGTIDKDLEGFEVDSIAKDFNLVGKSGKDLEKGLKQVEFALGKGVANATRVYVLGMQESTAATDDLEETLIRLRVAAKRAEDAIEHQADNFRTFISAGLSLAQANLGVERSALNLEKAERELARTRQETVSATRDITEREFALARARLSQRQAVFDLADAERDITRARINQVDAARNLDRAFVGQGDAARDLTRAREDLVRAEEDFIDTQRELADNTDVLKATLNFEQAELNLAQAQLAVKESALDVNKALIAQLDLQLALSDAQFDLEKAQRRGRAGARDQLRAITAIQKAHLQQADAALEPERVRLAAISTTLSLREAELSLREAELALQKVLSGDQARRDAQDADRKLEDAHIKLRDATFGVEDADIRLRDAHFSLEDATRDIERAEFTLESRRLDLAIATFGVESAEIELAKSHERLIDLDIELRERELALKEAHLAQRGAIIQSVFALDDYNNALAALSGNTVPAEKRVATMRDRFNELGGEIREVNTALGLIPSSLENLIATNNISNVNIAGGSSVLMASSGDAVSGDQVSGWVGPDGFAKGGLMRAGQLGLVGEKGFELFAEATGKHFRILGADGPELFRPKLPGRVIPHEQVGQFVRNQATHHSSSSSSTTTSHRGGDINTNVYVKETDPDVIGHKISRYIARRSKR